MHYGAKLYNRNVVKMYSSLSNLPICFHIWGENYIKEIDFILSVECRISGSVTSAPNSSQNNFLLENQGEILTEEPINNKELISNILPNTSVLILQQEK